MPAACGIPEREAKLSQELASICHIDFCHLFHLPRPSLKAVCTSSHICQAAPSRLCSPLSRSRATQAASQSRAAFWLSAPSRGTRFSRIWRGFGHVRIGAGLSPGWLLSALGGGKIRPSWSGSQEVPFQKLLYHSLQTSSPPPFSPSQWSPRYALASKPSSASHWSPPSAHPGSSPAPNTSAQSVHSW